jgi:hypothetical protein
MARLLGNNIFNLKLADKAACVQGECAQVTETS